MANGPVTLRETVVSEYAVGPARTHAIATAAAPMARALAPVTRVRVKASATAATLPATMIPVASPGAYPGVRPRSEADK